MVSRRSFLIGATNATLAVGLGAACSGGSAERSQTSTTESSLSTTTTSPPARFADADFAALDRFLAETNGRSFTLLERGQSMHEWTRDDGDFRRDVASAQKSVLSLLVGRAVADGRLALDTEIDEVLGTDWTDHGATAGITVQHLLAMTSGLDDDLSVVAEPGEVWLYSGAFAQLFDVLTVVTGRRLNDVARGWLFEPVGATTARFYERRASGVAPIGLWAGTGDLAAIGQAVSDRSVPGLGDEWYEASFSPSQDHNEAYGLLWWLNGQDSFRLPGERRDPTDGPLIGTAPTDLVAALGKDDQKLYVSRELDLVVARLGDRASPQTRRALSTFDADLWRLLTELAS